MKKAAIWVDSDKNGNELLRIKTADGQLLNGIHNQFKTEEKHPDFQIVDFSKTDEEGRPTEVGAAWYGKTKKGALCLKIRTKDGEYFTAMDNKFRGENTPQMVVVG